MQDWEGERRAEAGPVFEEIFPAGQSPERLGQQLRALGRRRKRFVGWKTAVGSPVSI